MLKDLRCAAQLPAGDLTRARRWYSEKLGLEPLLADEFALHYECARGTLFTVYQSPTAGTAQQTVMGWLTGDLKKEVEDLKARGVVFESFDLPGLKTDENHIADLGGDRVAWFKDSEGNVLVVGQPRAGGLEV